MKRVHRLFVSCLLWARFGRRSLGVTLILLIAFGGSLYAQDSCLAACTASDSPCSGLKGRDYAQCRAQCEQKCRPTRPPSPLLDPRCGVRTATGKFNCTIDQPVVTQHETVYPTVQFAPGDIVEVKADGCVQTGGSGDTWKRYVNPTGGGTDTKYHGLILIPTAKPAGSGLVRIQTVIGKLQTVTGVGMPASELVLHLGYEDDGYSDNGYYNHDNGNDDQCKTDGSNDGGPAHVTITIYRAVKPDGPPVSRFDFDVLSSSIDPNGLPYNPQWSWQQRPGNHGQIPSTSLCHDFSERPTVLGIPQPKLVPNFPDCTDQTDLNSVDLPDGLNAELCQLRKGGPIATGSFTGHINWFPVTVEGRASWGDHGLDDDYTFTFYNDEEGYNPLSVNGRSGLHVEFDSEETIDHFTSDEWAAFHRAVDGNDNELRKRLFDGHTILTGMFGMDGEHDLKAELHPLFAIATRRDFGSDPSDDVWLMFVRNRGDEGFCSSQLWDAGFEDYTFHLPWLSGMASVDVHWSKTHFEGADGTSGPTVAVLPPPVPPLAAREPGVYVTFHLGPAASSPFIEGVLHLAWTGQTVVTTRRPSIVTRRAAGGGAAGEFDEVEHMIQAAVNQLTPAQREEIKKARVADARPAVHRLPPGTGVRRITAAPPIARVAALHAIKAGPATGKANRDAAQMRALCRAFHGVPPNLPVNVCKGTVRDHR